MLSLFKHEQLRIGFVAALLQQHDTRRELLSIGTLVGVSLLTFLAHTTSYQHSLSVNVRSGFSISLIEEIPWLTQLWWEMNTLFFPVGYQEMTWSSGLRHIRAVLQVSPTSGISASVTSISAIYEWMTYRLAPRSFLWCKITWDIHKGYLWEFRTAM